MQVLFEALGFRAIGIQRSVRGSESALEVIVLPLPCGFHLLLQLLDSSFLLALLALGLALAGQHPLELLGEALGVRCGLLRSLAAQ